MTEITRRSLLAGTAAGVAIAASPAVAGLPQAEPDLTGKSILITGCSSGFGRAGALYYARRGAKVFATMRNTPRPEGAELERIARDEGLDLAVMQLDVRLEDEIEDTVARAQAAAGGALDVLVNNAGVGITGPVEVQDMEATQLAFDTNVFGYHRMARAVLPAMRQAGTGQIFNVSSQLGRVIAPSAGHYSATKFAVEAMSEQLAYELVPHGIEVTIIEPGGYPTEIWKNRNRYNNALKARAGEDHLSGYPALVARMGQETGEAGEGRNTEIDDVPRAIAQIIAMPPGTRPLRRAVHPRFIPQTAINEVSRQTQLDWLGDSSAGPWIKAVHG